LRWPASQPDPDVRVGGWIADVTYERFNATEISRFYTLSGGEPASSLGLYPAQRCFWYRIVKRSDPTTDHDGALTGFREMVVTVGSDVRARTKLNAGANGAAAIPIESVHINAALVSPYVVNVVSRVFYTR
jgi:hypothetical protein